MGKKMSMGERRKKEREHILMGPALNIRRVRKTTTRQGPLQKK